MSKKTGVAILIVSLIAIIMSVTALVISISMNPEIDGVEKTDIQYIMYLGTNDKDTNEPVYSKEESMEKAKEILINNFGGYTIQEANGGWVDNDKEYQEYTLVIYLSDTDPNHVHKAADQMIDVFHQSSILIQHNRTLTEFYTGS